MRPCEIMTSSSLGSPNVNPTSREHAPCPGTPHPCTRESVLSKGNLPACWLRVCAQSCGACSLGVLTPQGEGPSPGPSPAGGFTPSQ